MDNAAGAPLGEAIPVVSGSEYRIRIIAKEKERLAAKEPGEEGELVDQRIGDGMGSDQPRALREVQSGLAAWVVVPSGR